jgi:hypothetical protein
MQARLRTVEKDFETTLDSDDALITMLTDIDLETARRPDLLTLVYTSDAAMGAAKGWLLLAARYRRERKRLARGAAAILDMYSRIAGGGQ